MLDRVLSEPKEVRTRDTVGVLPVPDMIRSANDDGPRPRRCAGDDGLVFLIGSNNLELGPITAIKNRTVIDTVRIWIDRRQISPIPGT